MSGAAVIEVRDLVKLYEPRRSRAFSSSESAIRAVDGVSLDVFDGETLGIVGESGCGKSTTARLMIGLERATSGEVRFEGADVTRANPRELRALWRQMQLVFQDPYASLNPRLSIRNTVAEPLRLAGVGRAEAYQRVDQLLEQVGLSAQHANRFPGEFSGGQRQRIGIARALALSPRLVILDEPVSALDVSVQAQVLNLLRDLQRDLGLTYVFISHDLSVVRHLCTRVAVMYLGKVVEIGSTSQIFNEPTHPYTQALLSAVPVPDPERPEDDRRIILEGDLPSASNPPSGCRFRTRCWMAQDVCALEVPQLVTRAGTSHPSACHFAGTDSSSPTTILPGSV